MASSNPNKLANILPGAGTSFSVHADTEVFAGSVDSDCMKANVIKFKKVNLTSAQILALSATPVQLIAAPGSGYVITLHKANLRMAPSGTAYANGGNTVIQYKTGTVAATNVIANTVINAAGTTVSNTIRNGIDVAAVANSDLEITNAAAPFITGTGIAQVQLWYSITTLET
jgi:hypothetical protein